jgi:hypothetical protein
MILCEIGILPYVIPYARRELETLSYLDLLRYLDPTALALKYGEEREDKTQV